MKTLRQLTNEPKLLPAEQDNALELLARASADFAIELDRTALFQKLAKHFQASLQSSLIDVYRIDDDEISWTANASQELHPVASQAPIPSHVRKVMQTLEPSCTRVCDHGSNMLVVPLLASQNRVLAIVVAERIQHDLVFTEDHLRLAVSLANVAAAAVDRARLFDRMESWSQSIEMLLSFNATINQPLAPRAMLRKLIINAIGFIEADGGAAGVVVHDGLPLSDGSHRVMESEGIFSDGHWHQDPRRWRLGEGLPGSILETEFPRLVDDYQNDPVADGSWRIRFDIGSCICVPIKNHDDEVLGFFKLHRRRQAPRFNWQEAAMLESLGRTVAVAIENARLVTSLERRNEQVRQLSVAHVRRLEEERGRIARELHDETGQVLIGLKLRLQLLSQNLMPCQIAAKQELEQLRFQVNEAAVQLKDLAKNLRPPTLDALGLEATVRQLIAEHRKQVNFKIRLEAEVWPSFSKDDETALYRIIQESLTNIIKHSAPSLVTISVVELNEQTMVVIEDDGCGFDASKFTDGLGLIGMKERAKMLGARITIDSRVGWGTKLTIAFRSTPS